MRFSPLDKLAKHIEKYSPVDRRVFLICIGLSSLFWMIKKMSNIYPVHWPLKVTIQHPPEIDLVTPIPDAIIADLEGNGWDLMFFGMDDFEINFDYQEKGSLSISKYSMIKAIEEKIADKKIKINGLSSDGFSISFDSLAKKKVPIILDYEISTAPSFNLKGIPSVPIDSVWVYGPKVLLDELFHVKNMPIKYSQLKETVMVETALKKTSQQVSITPEKVVITIPVEAETEKQVYVSLEILNSPIDSVSSDSLVVYPQRVSIAFVLGLSKYNDYTASDFKVAIDLSGHEKEGAATTTPILVKKYPADISNLTVIPKSARFFYVQKDTLAVEPSTDLK